MSKLFEGRVKIKTVIHWVIWGLRDCKTEETGAELFRDLGNHGLGIFVTAKWGASILRE